MSFDFAEAKSCVIPVVGSHTAATTYVCKVRLYVCVRVCVRERGGGRQGGRARHPSVWYHYLAGESAMRVLLQGTGRALHVQCVQPLAFFFFLLLFFFVPFFFLVRNVLEVHLFVTTWKFGKLRVRGRGERERKREKSKFTTASSCLPFSLLLPPGCL